MSSNGLVRVGLFGTGHAVPERVLANREFERMVDTSDEWIRTRTGIQERRIVAEGQCTSDLGAEAARGALQAAGVDPADVDLVLAATITPDTIFPSCACHIQHKIGAVRAAALDLSAACSGFLYGIATGTQFIRGGLYRNVLVIGAETLSKITDYKDRNTCILFGDGAGAVLLRPTDGPGEILDVALGADGSNEHVMVVPAGGARVPASYQSVEDRMHFMRIKGREVFKFATLKMVQLVKESVARAQARLEEIALVVPHQVNMRILEAAAEKLGLPLDRMAINIQKYGNTSAASVPIALDEAVRDGRLKRGDLVVMVAFGAGLTWGAVTLRW